MADPGRPGAWIARARRVRDLQSERHEMSPPVRSGIDSTLLSFILSTGYLRRQLILETIPFLCAGRDGMRAGTHVPPLRQRDRPALPLYSYEFHDPFLPCTIF